MRKNTIVVSMAAVLVLLCGCSKSDVQQATETIEDINEMVQQSNIRDISDPDELLEYLYGNEEDEVPEEEEEEEVSYVTYNMCRDGYEKDGVCFAVKVDSESGENVYSFADLDEVSAAGEQVIYKSGLYDRMADEYTSALKDRYTGSDDLLSDKESYKRAIMTEADILLYISCYPEDKRCEELTEIADAIGDQLYINANMGSSDALYDYNTSAVLAMISNVLDGQDEDYTDKAKELWEHAEAEEGEDTLNACRAWAAAELYRATGIKTYRTVCEAVAGDIELLGVSYEDPGYYGMYAYLNCQSGTDYNVSSKMMTDFFAYVNSMIKSDRQVILSDSITAENMKDNELTDSFVNSLIDEAKLSMVANYISLSVEYTGYAKDRVIFLAGANPTGNDYLGADYTDTFEPALFTLMSLGD